MLCTIPLDGAATEHAYSFSRTTLCTIDFCKQFCFRRVMKADLRISIKDYHRNSLRKPVGRNLGRDDANPSFRARRNRSSEVLLLATGNQVRNTSRGRMKGPRGDSLLLSGMSLESNGKSTVKKFLSAPSQQTQAP